MRVQETESERGFGPRQAKAKPNNQCLFTLHRQVAYIVDNSHWTDEAKRAQTRQIQSHEPIVRAQSRSVTLTIKKSGQQNIRKGLSVNKNARQHPAPWARNPSP